MAMRPDRQPGARLAALANHTKWSELQRHMAEQGPRAPLWRTLDTTGFQYPPRGWDGDWTYHFRLDDEYRTIEWCEMQPRAHPNAMPLQEVSSTCQRIGFETEVLAATVKVLGYRRL